MLAVGSAQDSLSGTFSPVQGRSAHCPQLSAVRLPSPLPPQPSPPPSTYLPCQGKTQMGRWSPGELPMTPEEVGRDWQGWVQGAEVLRLTLPRPCQQTELGEEA